MSTFLKKWQMLSFKLKTKGISEKTRPIHLWSSMKLVCSRSKES